MCLRMATTVANTIFVPLMNSLVPLMNPLVPLNEPSCPFKRTLLFSEMNHIVIVPRPRYMRTPTDVHAYPRPRYMCTPTEVR